METQTWLSCQNKFILAENITILSVSSDDIYMLYLKFQTGFDPGLKRPGCLATLKSCDTTKLSVDDNIL